MIIIINKEKFTLDDYYLLKEKDIHYDLLLDKYDLHFKNNFFRSQEEDNWFEEQLYDDYLLIIKFDVNYLGHNYKLYFAIDKEDKQGLRFILDKTIENNDTFYASINNLVNKLNKQNLSNILNHKLFTNNIYEITEINSNIINDLVITKQKDKLKQVLLDEFQYFRSTDLFTNKIAQIHTSSNESDYIFIKYYDLNELYYKIVSNNFDYLFTFMKYDFDKNISIEENLKNIINDRYFSKTLDIKIY